MSPLPGARVPIWNSWRIRPVDRLAVFQRRRKPRRHAVIGARRARIPARPDEAVAAPERKAEPGIRGRSSGRWLRPGRPGRIVEQVKIRFRAAVGHVVDEHAAGPARIGRPQDEEIGLVFDEAARVARRLVEIDDGLVLGRGRIELAFGDAADAQIGTGLAEGLAFGKGLDHIQLDFDIRHRMTPCQGRIGAHL